MSVLYVSKLAYDDEDVMVAKNRPVVMRDFITWPNATRWVLTHQQHYDSKYDLHWRGNVSLLQQLLNSFLTSFAAKLYKIWPPWSIQTKIMSL